MTTMNTGQATITMGGVTLLKSEAKIMSASYGANGYDTLRHAGGHYVVPVGKKLIIRAVRWVNETSTANLAAPSIGYGDTGLNTSATPPTNAVTIGTGGRANTMDISASAYARQEYPCYFEIPAGKYPYAYSATIGECIILGEEVSA